MGTGSRTLGWAGVVVIALALAPTAASAQGAGGSHGPPGGIPGMGGSPGAAGGVASHVFDPILRRRDFSTGRAQVTESPITTPDGQVLVEVGVGDVSAARADTLRALSASVAPLGVAWGAAPRFDLRLDVESWSHDRLTSTTSDAVESTSGFGDVHLKARTCLAGDDSSAAAVGLELDLRAPHTDPATGSTRLDGGVIVPAAFELPAETHLGVMGEVDVRDDVADDGRHAEFVGSASLSHGIGRDVTGFTEFVSVSSAEAGVPWLGVVDGGVYWDVTPQLSFGAGLSFGVSDAGGDRGGFAGLSWHRRVR